MKNLFVFFTNIKGLTDINDGPLDKMLGKDVFENGNDIFVRYLDGQTQLINIRGFKPENYPQLPCVMLVNDSQNIPEKAIGISYVLQHLIAGIEQVYVVYHSRTLSKNKSGFEAICANKIQGSAIPQNHISGSIYDKYLFKLLTSDQDIYSTTVQSLLTQFPSKVLEAQLELLHRCLVPSDAPKTIDDFNHDFPALKSFSDSYSVFLDAKKNLRNRDTGEVHTATDEDVFHAEYIEAVKQLRIALLGS